MSPWPFPRGLAEGVMVYSRQYFVNSVSVYCHGCGESCLQHSPVSSACCWIRDNKLLRNGVLQGTSFWAAVSGAGALLCLTSVPWKKLCLLHGSAVSSPLAMLPSLPIQNQTRVCVMWYLTCFHCTPASFLSLLYFYEKLYKACSIIRASSSK